MSKENLGYQSSLKATAPVFNFTGPLPSVVAPVFTSGVYTHPPPPPIPVQYTFIPGAAYIPQVPGTNWSPSLRFIPPSAAFGIQQYAEPAEC